MKKLLVFVMLLVATIAESQAQEHIDALLNGDIESNRHGLSLRSAVKRDPATGEIIKRVVELTAIDDKSLAKEFIAAFKFVSQIHFDNAYYRSDIGAKALKAREE